MVYKKVKVTVCTLAAALTFAGMGMSAEAAVIKGKKHEMIALDESPSDVSANRLGALVELSLTAEAVELGTSPVSDEVRQYRNLVIARVRDYVNVRSTPGEDGEVLGKLYNNSVGTFISEENGWYQINSGSVTGYVKADYCVTGDAAVEIAKKVAKRIATVTTQTLFVRKEPSTEAGVVGMVPEAEQLLVLEEMPGWVKVDIEEGTGWVSADYVTLHSEFVEAESKAEEAKRLAKEASERKAAQEAAAKAAREAAAKAAQSAQSSQSTQNSTSGQQSADAAQSSSAPSSTTQSSATQDTAQSDSAASADSETGRAVADYALQFVGNPYVYGGTSLTNGADCSGFVMSVYANFGVSLPHSSSALRSKGYAVSGLSNARPGDLICYSGHVGIYIGDGKIVHASSSKTGIITSKADYREILAIRRIF